MEALAPRRLRVTSVRPAGLVAKPHHGRGDPVLTETEHPTSGKPLLQAAKYNFSEGARGTGIRLLVSTLERDYERLPDDFDPR